jgi:very-short-patch-repair endonuclease
MEEAARTQFQFNDLLEYYKMGLRRLCEISIENLQQKYPTPESLDGLGECYLRAYLKQLFERVLAACNDEAIDCPAPTWSDFLVQWELIVKFRPSLATASKVSSLDLKSDVLQRLESYKRRIGDEFAREFREVVGRHEIVSPIEQIFLLEWKHQRIEETFDVELIPQAEVASRIGNFALDFLVRSKSPTGKNVRIGIELDGHDFHEKTRQQTTRDKQRERAIMLSGITVLRFTGSEIVSQTSKCIREIIDFLKCD